MQNGSMNQYLTHGSMVRDERGNVESGPSLKPQAFFAPASYILTRLRLSGSLISFLDWLRVPEPLGRLLEGCPTYNIEPDFARV
jgi:hypothetical protein